MALSKQTKKNIQTRTGSGFSRGSYLKQYWFIYGIFILVMSYYVIFKYIPMYGVIIAFKKYTPTLGIWGSKWIGIRILLILWQYVFHRTSKYFDHKFKLISHFPPIIFA